MSHFITDAGLEFDVRLPQHGDDPVHHDDPYVLSQAVPIVMSSPFCKSLGHPAKRQVEQALRESWSNPLNDHLVAVLHDDPAVIIGFAWGSRAASCIDYLHVRGSFRGQGLGALLARMMGVQPGHLAAVRFDTSDLSRPAATEKFPVGLLHNSRWVLRLLPHGLRGPQDNQD